MTLNKYKRVFFFLKKEKKMHAQDEKKPIPKECKQLQESDSF